MNSNVNSALNEVIDSMNESDEFKRKFKKYVENYFIGSTDKDKQDLKTLLNLISMGDDLCK